METQEYQQMYKLENHHWWFLAKRNFISAVFPKKKNLAILDIGAGTGGTTKFLKNTETFWGWNLINWSVS